MEMGTVAEIILAIIAIAKIVTGVFKIEKADSIIKMLEKIIGEFIKVFKIEINDKENKK